jgi:hypothetical protein
MESKQNIIAKSKTTELIIQVTYTDKHITKGFVLVGDAFNKVGAVDYWSTSTLDIKGNDMKKFKVGTKLIVSDVPNLWFNFAKTKEDPIVKQVVDSFQERSKVGIEKYGTTLHENNTDDFLEHLQQELMDATLYIQKLKTIKPCLEDFSMSEMVEYLRENGYKVKYKL